MSTGSVEPVDFKLLFEKSPGLYLVLNPLLRIAAVSDAYCKATHIRREEVIGKNLFDIFPDDETRPSADGAQNLRASLERVLSLKRPDSMAIQRYDVIGPDGASFEERYWSPRNSPILDETGQIRWIIHRVYDVTAAQLNPGTPVAQKSLEQNQRRLIIELQRMNEQLAELDGLRENLMKMGRLHTVATMASALAHDVSQPLTAARNFLGVLKRDAVMAEGTPLAETLGKAISELDRAGAIVKGLRRFMSTGNVDRRTEKLDAIVADAIRLIEASARLHEVTVRANVSPSLPEVLVNRAKIQQVLVNLLSNAIEAANGRRPREIDITASQEGDRIAVYVRDNGPGIDPEIVTALYQPFTSTKKEGLGLGLAICRSILDEYGGSLKLSSTGPEGTVFLFTLPIVQSALDS